jgi:hypothetical protein
MLRAREAAAFAHGELPEPTADAEAALGPEGARAERESRAALHERLEAARRGRTAVVGRVPAKRRPVAFPTWRWWHVALPAAAVAVAVMLWPRGGREIVRVGDGRLVAWSQQREIPSPEWRTGDAFKLFLRLEREAYPLVFHVDPRGALALIYPDTSRTRPHLFAAGEVALPAPEDDLRWAFSGPAGTETFLIAAARKLPALASLYSEAVTAAGTAGDRERRITALGAFLEKRFGSIQRIDAPHLP